MGKIVTALMIAVFAGSFVTAQQSRIFTDDLAEYNQALDLYQEDQYLASQRLFEQVKETTTDETIKANAAYYIANCAVRLNQRNADELVENFVEEYPTSTKKSSAIIDVADYYFDNGNYRKASVWYEKVDKSTLSRKQISRYNFNTGYTLVQSRKYDEAKPYLNRVSDDPEYGSKAKYYLGYIAYEGDELQEASDLFDQAGTSPEEDEKLSYYQADLNYKLGKFEKAIDLAEQQMPKSNRREQSQLNRIIGQSLFNLERYDESLPYLEKYEGTRGKWNNNDYYQLGYAYYKQGNLEKAVETFNKIVDGENKTAQNAYYHLGQSYIKLDRNEDALTAFKKASEMELDPQIKEDASYNYAKLSYEYGNPYDSVPAVILNYLESYPDSEHQEEMNGFLIDSYFSSKNYAEALKLLEDGRIKGNEAVYGKVALYHGLNLFTNADYAEAIVQLNKAIDNLTDPELKKKAVFWKAESLYQSNNFSAAFEAFQTVKGMNARIEEDQLFAYDMGYTQFKLKKYDEAISSFESFTRAADAGTDKVRLNDAYLRIGDANFVTKNYWPAMEAYNKAIEMNTVNGDYAAFQKGISYGFVGKVDRKIEDLEGFIRRFKTSQYRDDVLYELGNTYINNDQMSKGIKTYDQLTREFPNSIYTAPAMMRKGLQLYNSGNLDAALTEFKKVAEKYSGTPQANQALTSAKQIYIDQGRVSDYAAWARTIDGVEITDNELEEAAYESAEQPLLREDTKGTIRGMRKYLEEFPNGANALKAHFYLAQALYTDGQKDQSIAHYDFVVSKQKNEYTEQALARLSEIHLGKKDYVLAVPVLQQLEQMADFPQNVIYAQSNLMKAYYGLEQFDKAATYAEKVLANSNIDNNLQSDAQIIIARSSWKRGNESAAKTAYEAVRKTATGSLAAESIYYKAYFENKEGKHDAAISTVNELSKNYGGYKLWSAKGLVVMAKSYQAKKETLNATTILEAVIANFKQYPDVVNEAQTELNKIKTNAAKTNSSVVPTGQN
ncbi:tetratricopeptide repeat protein [Nonlabens xiamenensis]|uniref:tetratricopeptide repeat protein n=1 Tax=Nonlabens xiamenensis TaxID=2341043 RepID=UPI000F61471B|nr:tetratricopeptide repeat protein [Nonlabens xiamenensis]